MKLLGLNGQNSEAQVLMYVYVAPPTSVRAWSMALWLRQRIKYYYYTTKNVTVHCDTVDTYLSFTWSCVCVLFSSANVCHEREDG